MTKTEQAILATLDKIENGKHDAAGYPEWKDLHLACSYRLPHDFKFLARLVKAGLVEVSNSVDKWDGDLDACDLHHYFLIRRK